MVTIDKRHSLYYLLTNPLDFLEWSLWFFVALRGVLKSLIMGGHFIPTGNALHQYISAGLDCTIAITVMYIYAFAKYTARNRATAALLLCLSFAVSALYRTFFGAFRGLETYHFSVEQLHTIILWWWCVAAMYLAFHHAVREGVERE